MTKIDLLISLIIFIIIMFYNINLKIKNKNVYKDELYKQSKKLNMILYLISFIIFISIIVFQIVFIESTLTLKNIIEYILNALSIALIPTPLILNNLYISAFQDEEKISHTKTIITNIIDEKLIKKFQKAGINLLIISKEKQNIKIKSIKESEIKKFYLSKTIIIESDNINCLDNIVDSKTTIFEFKNLKRVYKQIEHSRGVHDNFIKAIKFIITSYLSLFISYLLLIIFDFPITYNLLFILLFKLYTLIITQLIYKRMPYEKDLMSRLVKPSNLLIEKQELIFNIIASFCISFAASIPYMGVLAQGATQELASTLFILIFSYATLFLTYSYLNEKFLLINLFQSYQNIHLLIFTIIHILITISFNFITYFGTMNVELKNNISSIIFGLLPIMFLELIKLARFTTMKGNNKNGIKNNKKYQRSKLNNS